MTHPVSTPYNTGSEFWNVNFEFEMYQIQLNPNNSLQPFLLYIYLRKDRKKIDELNNIIKGSPFTQYNE